MDETDLKLRFRELQSQLQLGQQVIRNSVERLQEQRPDKSAAMKIPSTYKRPQRNQVSNPSPSKRRLLATEILRFDGTSPAKKARYRPAEAVTSTPKVSSFAEEKGRKTPREQSSTRGNISDDQLHRRHRFSATLSPGRQRQYHSEFLRSFKESERRSKLQQTYAEKLLDAGNDRREFLKFDRKPKSILTHGAKTDKVSDTHVTFMSPKENNMTVSPQGKSYDQPLLGYDWIAGLMDNNMSIADRSQAYFDEIKEFRLVNMEECSHKYKNESEPKANYSILPDPNKSQEDKHVCVHDFVVNKRYFAVPIHEGPDGKSVCPICRKPQKNKYPIASSSPSFIRVSIPRSTLETPYKIQPHRRSSFDPGDSLALSENCMLGCQSTTSYQQTLPADTSLCLKDALDKPDPAKSMAEAREGVPPLAAGVSVSVSPSKRTDDLLKLSHSLRYQLHQLKEADREKNTSQPN